MSTIKKVNPAEDILENLITNNEKLRKEFEETHKLKKDPRTLSLPAVKNVPIKLPKPNDES